jgi:hypothetical protein
LLEAIHSLSIILLSTPQTAQSSNLRKRTELVSTPSLGPTILPAIAKSLPLGVDELALVVNDFISYI